MKILCVSLALFLIHFSMYAQITGTSEVSILSPKAASIIKYGEHPVSLHTGLIDISVPVYTIQASGFNVPIALKYHASGLKFDDVSNEVGLGWTLMAGGVITRSIRGAGDGLFGTFSRDINTFKTCDDSSPQDNEYVRLKEVENGSRGNSSDGNIGRLDGEIDMYSFSFLNHSGSFCFPFLNSEVNGSAPSTGLFIPASGMKVINRNLPNLRFDLLDTDGVYYKFEVKDVDQNEHYKEYYLTQIISANKADTIDFIYEVISGSSIYIRRPFINYSASVTTVLQIYTGHGGFPGQDFASEDGGIYYQSLRPPRLKRIDFRGGHVSFDYAVVNNIPTWDLQQINIYNSTQSTPLQTISLTKSSFLNGEKRLDKVTFTSSEDQSYDYQFGYNGEPTNIYSSGTQKGIDYWGYFNGASVPFGKRYAPIVGNAHVLLYQGTNREASESAMQKGILNKITYPTRGYSEFTYEAHQARYSLSMPIQTFGGVRIREIRNYLPDGSLAEKKWYRYGQNESGYGTTDTYLTENCEDFTSETRIIFTEDSPEHLCQVKIKRTYSTFPRISYFLSGSSVVYGTVTEYVGTEVRTPTGYIDEAYGKTIYGYESTPNEKMPSSGDTYRLFTVNVDRRTYPWKTGNLLTKEVYRKTGTSYQQIYLLRNFYKDINTAEFRNVRVLPNVEFEYNYIRNTPPDIKSLFCNFPAHRQQFGGSSTRLTPYDYFNYYTTTGQRVLTSTEETTDGVSTYTSYDTYNGIGLPTNFTRTTSTGDNITTTLRYPADFTNSTYINMQSANIQTPVIEKIIDKNGSFLKKEIATYQSWYGQFYAPQFYSEQYRDGDYETKTEYSYNSRGNTQHIAERGVTKSVYLWGYNNRYPIAEIKNAIFDQVSNILGSTLIERVARAETPSPADLTAISNLRSSISGAHITTYTYTPLLGMTSQTDPNGVITYFEYDTFGRLTLVKDNNGAIIKKLEYNYKQE